MGGFFASTLLWLIPTLALWYWARDWVVVPVAWLSDKVMRLLGPSWVSGTSLNGITQKLLTTLPMSDGSGKSFVLTPEASVLNYCYGLPLLIALLLAARAKGLWWKLPACALGLVPFQAWGVCFAWLLKVAVRHGQSTQASTSFTGWDVMLIGLGHQLGFLLLPTLAPLLMWLYLERSFVLSISLEASREEGAPKK